MAEPMDGALRELLEETRRREKAQALFYRALAAAAEAGGDEAAGERLNALLADEQHHLSRVTARLLEEGETAGPLDGVATPAVELDRWEEGAGFREAEEVSWYRELLAGTVDPRTRQVVEEILASELHHLRELGGKWMPAEPGGPPGEEG